MLSQEMKNQVQKVDVLVVGAGPAGMAAAIADVVKATGEGTAMADAVAATAGTNAEMYSIADGIANKLFVAYAAYTK